MLIKIILFCFIFIIFFDVQAKKNLKLSPFQKNIQRCLGETKNLDKMNSLQKIYDYISARNILVSSVVLEREVLFKEKNIQKKLKYVDGKLTLYKILNNEQDALVPIANDVRQKSLTIESYISQLLIHADVQYDWMKTQEQRSDRISVLLTVADREIKSLKIDLQSSKKKLDCSRFEGSDICSCTNSK